MAAQVSVPCQVHHVLASTTGGAGLAASNIIAGLERAGVQQTVNQRHSPQENEALALAPETGLQASLRARIGFRLARMVDSGSPHVENVQLPWSYLRGKARPEAFAGPTVLHLHYISGWLDLPGLLRSVPRSVPIVWTLHDLTPITGGCPYPYDCQQFMSLCRQCPQVAGSDPLGLVERAFRTKQRLLRGRQVAWVGVSPWAADVARSSGIRADTHSVSCIPYAIDSERFSAQPKAPHDGPLRLGFVSVMLQNERKGLRLLREALDLLHLTADQVRVVLVGRQPPPWVEADPRFEVVGPMENDTRLAQFYGSLDLLAVPSLGETFGMTPSEAGLCGTPSVVFPVGGLPQQVVAGKTGFVTQAATSQALAEALQDAMAGRADLAEMGRHAREYVAGTFTFERQAQSYLELYRQLVS